MTIAVREVSGKPGPIPPPQVPFRQCCFNTSLNVEGKNNTSSDLLQNYIFSLINTYD